MKWDPFAWMEQLSRPPEMACVGHPVHGTQVSRETFLLPDLWALHFYDYYGVLEVDRDRFDLHPGSVTLVPPGATVTFHYLGASRHLYCHFRCEKPKGRGRPSALFLRAEPRLQELKSRLAECLAFFHRQPRRAHVRLWDVLWGLASARQLPSRRSAHESVMENAAQIAAERIAGSLTVSELARRCGLSHNQFIRLVQQRTGMTPRAWLQRLRTDRAAELLAYSDLPVKVIACEVGIPDLQHFNKVIRQRFSCSPRAFRQKLAAT